MKRLVPALTLVIASCVSEKSQPVSEKAPVADTMTTATSQVPTKDAWVVTYQGIGEVRTGMTVDQVNTALKDDLGIPAMRSDCEYMSPRNEPKGVSFLFENGTLSVIDVKSGTVKTVEGAGIGDTETTVDSLYRGQVVTQPAKYTSGHRLIVTPKTGGDHRIVFETDGMKVTQFSSGREPAVEYVEGCG